MIGNPKKIDAPDSMHDQAQMHTFERAILGKDRQIECQRLSMRRRLCLYFTIKTLFDNSSTLNNYQRISA
ncbi:hypothetical protein DLM46_15790 [Paraburkholderia lacunae]|uniref:Uncharacterized protein n=1 Tax=Paraburkholderia lacunae TaxID=2211104 RepID=A0A370N8E0_9BURK|nr:hypothetical protein DLM46_15790 [Paraburkholderia lacunae]